MVTLYQIAQSNNGIVVGTGNKVEDFGVGFYTKYGDGGVDISPIADCTKTEVWELAEEIGVIKDIISAAPTDGLWDELEEAMENKSSEYYSRYEEIRKPNLHKMKPIPVCEIPKE